VAGWTSLISHNPAILQVGGGYDAANRATLTDLARREVPWRACRNNSFGFSQRGWSRCERTHARCACFGETRPRKRLWLRRAPPAAAVWEKPVAWLLAPSWPCWGWCPSLSGASYGMPPTVRAGDLAMTRAVHRSRCGSFGEWSDSCARSGHQTEGETAWSAFYLCQRSSRALPPTCSQSCCPGRCVIGEVGQNDWKKRCRVRRCTCVPLHHTKVLLRATWKIICSYKELLVALRRGRQARQDVDGDEVHRFSPWTGGFNVRTHNVVKPIYPSGEIVTQFCASGRWVRGQGRANFLRGRSPYPPKSPPLYVVLA